MEKLNTEPLPNIERDIGTFFFDCSSAPKCSKTPIDAIISSAGISDEDDIRFTKELYASILPSSVTVNTFPWFLPKTRDIAVLCITDEDAVIEFNSMSIKPGKGEFAILSYLLTYCLVRVLNHKDPLEVRYLSVNLPDTYRSDLCDVSLNTRVSGKIYTYKSGTFGTLGGPGRARGENPERTVITATDIPISRFKTNLTSGTIWHLRIDELMVERVTRFCHGKIHLLTVTTNPPCKDFVVKYEDIEEFLKEIEDILPGARIEGFCEYLYQSVYAPPEEAEKNMNRRLDILERNIQEIVDIGLISRDFEII